MRAPAGIAAAALLCGATLTACGQSSPAPLSAADAAALRQDVRAIATAASARRPQQAHVAAARLRADLERLSRDGRLSATDARPMLLAAAHAERRVASEVRAAPPATPTPAPAVAAPAPHPAPAPAPPAAPHGKGHGPKHDKGPGKGHGHDHAGGGDGG